MTTKPNTNPIKPITKKDEAASPAINTTQKPPTKLDAVLTMLRSASGATLTQLAEATGWLPHTTRAALSGLRKRGHDVARSKEGDVSIYRVVS